MTSSTEVGAARADSQRTVVHLLRHGEVHNPHRLLYGRMPGYHLSALGRRMADLAADHLRDHDITHLVSSPLERAQETAAPIADALGLEVTVDPQVSEAVNAFEGLPVAGGAGILRHPRLYPKMVNPFRPSWGEPYAEIAERMKAALHRARVKGAGHEAVCVSHQLPVETLRRAMTGKPLHHFPTRRLCNLASVTSFYFHGDTYVGWGYSELAGQ